MGAGKVLTYLTIWLALGGYGLGAAGLLLAARDRRRAAWARWAWTLGCAAFLAHVASAFTFYHGWSHASAYGATARETGEIIGYNFGGGVFVSYAFTALWTIDVLLWWAQGLHSYWGRLRAPRVALHAFMLFIIFNGTVIFEAGPVRYFGLALCLGLALIWLVSRRATARA